MPEHSVFSLEAVSFSFPGKPGLIHGLSGEVKRGEALVVVGPSGGGKSTLLKLLVGLLKPTQGSVLFDGRPWNAVRGRERRGVMRRIGMTFQNSGLFDSLSCRENLEFPLEEGGIAKSEWNDRVKASLAEVGLTGIEKLKPHEISGGMRKRLTIARALILRPDVILYDEPTAGLDPITSTAISSLIVEMRSKYQMTSVIVTSDLIQAWKTADRVAFLHGGNFLAVAPPEKMRTSQDPCISQFVHRRKDGPLTGGVA